MSERDAFGNLIDPKPAGASAPAAPAPATSAPAAPVIAVPSEAFGATALPPVRTAPSSPGSSPRRRRRGPGVGSFVALVVTASVLVPLAFGGWAVYRAWHDVGAPAKHAIEVISRGVTTATSGSTATTSPARSLLKPAEVRRVLAGARRADPRGLFLLRLSPTRADYQGLPAGAPRAQLIAYRSIDAHAPQRLIVAAAHRLHRSTKAINYVVLIKLMNKPAWSAYFQGGAAYQGDAHGRIVRRIQ